MLLELLVENYAVVEKLRIRFHPGLNVLTGETGSGKSIVVDALELLFGGRASADMMRSGATRARISGIFQPSPSAAGVLAEAGVDLEDGELIIEREILSGGKSRAFISSRPVTASLLRDLAPHLGDIHGQHEQQRLFSPDAQLDLLDAFAESDSLRVEIGQIYREWRQCAAELEETRSTAQEKLRLLDLWSFQKREIEAVRLKADEDTELESERRVLQNVGKLLEIAHAAYDSLYDAPESAYSQLRLAIKKTEELCRIDESLTGARDMLAPAQVAIEDATSALRDYLGKLEANPERLDEVESRLASIDKLKRKYSPSIAGIVEFLTQVQLQIEAAETTTERQAAIEKRQKDLASQYEKLAGQLSIKRSQAGAQLGKRVQSELKSLAMERTVFQVTLTPAPWSAAGADSVAFLVSPNLGEEPKPLERIASGGELSRIALALKTCVTEAVDGRSLVFDEVDAGVGGSAAESVGRRLKGLAARNQVLCVTHLAQIAGFADHHYAVEKRESRGRTVASVEELTGEARTREIGRMLSGQHLTPEALKHAEQLIRAGAQG